MGDISKGVANTLYPPKEYLKKSMLNGYRTERHKEVIGTTPSSDPDLYPITQVASLYLALLDSVAKYSKLK